MRDRALPVSRRLRYLSRARGLRRDERSRKGRGPSDAAGGRGMTSIGGRGESVWNQPGHSARTRGGAPSGPANRSRPFRATRNDCTRDADGTQPATSRPAPLSRLNPPLPLTTRINDLALPGAKRTKRPPALLARRRSDLHESPDLTHPFGEALAPLLSAPSLRGVS